MVHMVNSLEKIYDAVRYALDDGDDIQDIHEAIREAIDDFKNDEDDEEEDSE